ncbi:MAG: hypothetical protein KC684_05795 [Candidatus Omnitrophica bacterium]|nr:hypothetical protein [Candidatus Omnitrophota bacterium]
MGTENNKEIDKKSVGLSPRQNILILAAALLIGCYSFFLAERSTVLGHLGDEKLYLAVTVEFDHAVSERVLSDYHIQRILPLALVHYTIKALPFYSFNKTDIVNVFGFYNVLLLLILAQLWFWIAGELRLNVKALWAGFIVLFFNFMVLKYIPYIQVSTDLFAYTIGLALIYYYLKNNVVGLLLSTVLGAFCWPTAVYIGTFMMMFPRRVPRDEEVSSIKVPYHLDWWLAGGICIWILLQFQFIVHGIQTGRLYQTGVFSTGANRPLEEWLYLSMAIVLVYVFLVFQRLLHYSKLYRWDYWKSQLKPFCIILGGVILCGLKAFVHYAAKRQGAFPLDYLIKNIFITGTMQPASFLVTHTVYFGCGVGLLIFVFDRFCRIVHSYGVGLIIVTAIILGLSVHNESRLLSNFFPIMVPFIIKAAEGYIQKWYQLIILGLLGLVGSKFWLTIHSAPWDGKILEFPGQNLFMNFGPWMTHQMYVYQGIGVVLAVLVIYMTFFWRRASA